MRFRLMAAILGLGLMIAAPGLVVAQISDDQVPDQDAKPSPNVQMQYPSEQDLDSGSMSQGPMDPGSNDAGASDQTYNTPAPQEKNGVARISLIHGDVSTQRGDSGGWSAAALNSPVVAGDRVSTGDQARTELQLDYANMLRLAEHSQANINTLTTSQIQIQLGRGMANYTVLKNSDADAEIDTPNVSIRTERRESSFRILVTADDHTEVLVRKGEVEITTPQGGTRVGQNQFITIQGAGDQAQYKIGEAPARDDFDQWNTDRDNMIRNSVARRHTNDYYVGTEDLDNHGTWSEVPDYGPVWRPAEVDPDWAPYRDGRWVYEPYWGWTWVSYDDWGWAPYHYGRWMYIDGGWGWWPGPAYGYPFYRPIWAPAYVSFFGWGGGFGFGFGWGSVGWLPLGPCDHFHPWWGRWGGRFGEGRFNEFNRGGFAPLHGGTRFSNVNLALHDQHFRGGTTVSGNEFGKGRMRAVPMNHAQFQNAHFTTGRLPVSPSRESFSASGRPAAPSTTRNVPQNQHFFSARGTTGGGTTGGGPRSLGRPSQISNGNRPVGGPTGREVARPGNSSSNAGSNAGSNIGSNNGSNNGFHRFGESGANNHVRSSGPVNNGPVNNGPVNNGPVNNPPARLGTRGNSNWESAPRPGSSAGSMPARSSSDRSGGGWQRFSPMPPHPSPESARPSEAARPETARPGASGARPYRGGMEDRGSYGSPRSSGPASRSYSSGGRGYSGDSRPPLNMRQPIVTPRSYGAGPSGPYGGGSYGGNRGGYSGGGRPAPSFGGGGRSAPSGGAPHGGGGGGGGGSSHGGGGSSHGGGSSGGGSSHSSGGGGSRHGR